MSEELHYMFIVRSTTHLLRYDIMMRIIITTITIFLLLGTSTSGKAQPPYPNLPPEAYRSYQLLKELSYLKSLDGALVFNTYLEARNGMYLLYKRSNCLSSLNFIAVKDSVVSPLDGRPVFCPRFEDLMQIVVSLIWVESKLDSKAVSKAGALGLMQITPPAIEDAANYCELPIESSKAELLKMSINVRYGGCYLLHLYSQTGNWLEALLGYNGGYRQIENYRSGQPVTRETVDYLLRIRVIYGRRL